MTALFHHPRKFVTGLAGLALALSLPATAAAADPVAQHRELGDGVDRPIHDLSGEGDSSSLELNPAQLNSVEGFDLTLLGYQTVYDFARGTGFGAFASLNLGLGLALGFGVQALEPGFGGEQFDADGAHNRPMTKVSFGLAAGDGEWGSVGVGVHGVRRDGQRLRVPQLDLGATLRMTNYASFGAVARLGPTDLRDATYRPVLDLGGELAIRPLGTRWLELAGGVMTRTDQSQGRGFSNFDADHDLLPYGRLAVRYQGLEIAGEVQRVQVDILDENSLAILDETAALRGGVSMALAWDYGSVGVGVHSGLGSGVDGVAYRARFSTKRQGRAVWVRPVDAEAIELKSIGNQRTLIATLRRLERAEAAGERSILLIKADGFGMGWAAGQELRDALRRVRDAGGHVYAYAEQPNTRDYWIASVAEKVYVHPAGRFATVGLGARRLFYKDALAKIGVQVQSVHIDEYKSAHESFTRSSRSDYDREQRTALLDDTWDTVLYDIAQARGMSISAVADTIFESPLGPQEAVDAGFADAITHRDEVLETLGEQLDESGGVVVSLRRFAPTTPERETWSESPYYAVVLLEGTIIGGKSRTIPILDIKFTGGDTVADTIRALRGDSACKGIVLRVDSGGGSAFASEVMWREVALTREAWEKDKKGSPPIVVSMSDVAASGGYYVPVGADTIFAEPLTITGSIGVVYMHYDVSGLLDMLGVNVDRIERGSPAIDANAIWQPWSPEQLERQQKGIEQTYDLFLSRVSGGRGMTKEAINEVGRGHVWSGKRAKDIGLIDEFGGLREALDEVRERSGEPTYKAKDYPLRLLPSRPSLVQLLVKGAGSLVAIPVEKAAAAREAEAAEQLPFALRDAITRLSLSLLFLPQDEANLIMEGTLEIE
ncbi:peptidase S49, protease IV:Peptidase S49, SppA [Plesiocystis pacifica SIR-1]|uniref:Peptidase S49, protease IV:Peptidase S49, SppA n=1 Tax=Plesiocystis pacifica SIR-1 TaxID=391625 RepID=A6GK57_9BACT|nr:S49 family peptidase [Plesiocystis pacifica]EDM73741.1 peptidase S49, protease IV:Peptidase S49, SppA [Plesiocystis pacifica SIR-1]